MRLELVSRICVCMLGLEVVYRRSPKLVSKAGTRAGLQNWSLELGLELSLGNGQSTAAKILRLLSEGVEILLKGERNQLVFHLKGIVSRDGFGF